MTREQAIDIADKALGMTKEWRMRVRATVRSTIYNDTLEAADLESAARQAREIWEKILTNYLNRSNDDIEGDAIGYLSCDELEWELDLRDPYDGPWLSDARWLVEKLASVNSTNDLAEFVVRARELCKIDPTPTPVW